MNTAAKGADVVKIVDANQDGISHNGTTFINTNGITLNNQIKSN